MPFPLVGFDIEYPSKEVEETYQQLLREDNLTDQSFIIRPYPGLSEEGGLRDSVVAVQDMKIDNLEDDDLNSGKKKCKISFFLQKGCYATMVVKRMMVEKQ